MIGLAVLAALTIVPAVAIIGVALALRGRRRARKARIEVEQARGAPKP